MHEVKLGGSGQSESEASTLHAATERSGPVQSPRGYLRASMLFIGVVAVTVLAIQYVQERVEDARRAAELREAMRPFQELQTRHRHELAELKARLDAESREFKKRVDAWAQYVLARTSLAQELYNTDVLRYGKDEADLRHQHGIYLRVAFDPTLDVPYIDSPEGPATFEASN